MRLPISVQRRTSGRGVAGSTSTADGVSSSSCGRRPIRGTRSSSRTDRLLSRQTNAIVRREASTSVLRGTSGLFLRRSRFHPLLRRGIRPTGQDRRRCRSDHRVLQPPVQRRPVPQNSCRLSERVLALFPRGGERERECPVRRCRRKRFRATDIRICAFRTSVQGYTLVVHRTDHGSRRLGSSTVRTSRFRPARSCIVKRILQLRSIRQEEPGSGLRANRFSLGYRLLRVPSRRPQLPIVFRPQYGIYHHSHDPVPRGGKSR